MVFIFVLASVISSTLNSPSSRWFLDSLQLLTNLCIQANTRVAFTHLEYFFGSNTQTFDVNVVGRVITEFDCNLSFLSSILSSATSASFICGHSFIGFCKNEGPFNHKSLEARASRVVPLLNRSAGFIFVGTCFHIIGCNWLNFVDSISYNWFESSTASSNSPKYIHTITPECHHIHT